MRRENKYGTNKTIRFCQNYRHTLPGNHSPKQLCINKRNRWKLVNLLKEHAQSPDHSNKIILRRNYNFYQYNGYSNSLRENPPKHLSFARRPDFIYQPYVNFIKINEDLFNLALCHGWKFLNHENNLENLFDITSPDTPVVLIYFLDDLKYLSISDWFHARRHAFGRYFADFNTVCSGDYCPFGPKIRGAQRSDSRINQILFITGSNKKLSYDSWKRSKRAECYPSKLKRSEVKLQRQERYQLTKQAKATRIFD